MAESQLECMEDGLMPTAVPETQPQFYYSEQQRAALEQLLTNGDGAFKTLLKEEKSKDFLSAREIKAITSTFVKYKQEEDDGAENQPKKQPTTRAGLRVVGAPGLESLSGPTFYTLL